MTHRKRKTVREQAKAMIARHGIHAERYAHYKANDSARASTVLYWEDVEREITRLLRREGVVR